MIPRILAIAGSDSGGGAGLQADVKTITMLGGHAMTAVTAITAQNTVGVERIVPVPADMVLAQIDAVVRDIGVDAVKIGMVGSAEVVAALSSFLWGEGATFGTVASPSPHTFPGGERASAVPVVLDPVMVATSGAVLVDDDAFGALERLMARATLVTPNLPELALLAGETIVGTDDLRRAARMLADRLGTAVLAKGGHLASDHITDILVRPGAADPVSWTDPRIETRHSHGTGCTLSSAIACGLGAGLDLTAAIDRARRYVRAALLAAPGLGRGHGPMGHGLGMARFI